MQQLELNDCVMWVRVVHVSQIRQLQMTGDEEEQPGGQDFA